MHVEVHFAKIIFWGVQGSKNSEILAVCGKSEIGKLSWVYLSTNAYEIWFQHRKYLRPVQVEVHFAKIVFWGSRGPKTPKFSPILVNWKSASSPEFISQPILMKFGFSIENTSGQCKSKSILRKSHFGGPGVKKLRNFCRFWWSGDRQAILSLSLNQCQWNLVSA